MFAALVTGGCASGRDIDPGRPTIGEIRFTGLKILSAELPSLERILLESRGRAFDPLALKLDQLRIEAFGRAHGLFDAKVISVDTGSRGEPTRDIVFHVEEGPATTIESVSTSGLDTAGDDARPIVGSLYLRKGQIFDHDAYLGQKDEIEARLKTLGFAWARVDGRVTVDRDRNRARIEMTAVPGVRAVLNRVSVLGTEKVDSEKIRRHTGLKTGERFSLDAIEAGRGRLYNLGLFSSVKLDYTAADSAHPASTEVRYTVKEGPFHEFRLGFGFGFDLERTDIQGRLVYTKRYLFDGLRTLRIKLQPEYVAIPAFWSPVRTGPAGTADIEFTQLDSLLPPDRLRATVGYDLGVEYAFDYHGPHADLGLSKKFWRDRLELGAAYQFMYDFLFSVDPALRADSDLARGLYGIGEPYRLAWWYEEAALDLRDRPLDPRKGGYFLVRAEEGGAVAGGAFDYEKLTTEVRGYYPIIGRLLLAGRTEFGHIWSQGSFSSPITRRFFLGGQDSHRGFNYHRLAPQVASATPGSPALPIGGDEMFLTQAELRFLAVKLFGNWLEMGGFVDAGDVAGPGCAGAACKKSPIRIESHVDLTKLHYAVGGGLRYKTLVGTVRVDLGVRLNRLSATESDGTPNPDPHDRLALQISMGEAF